MIQTFFAFLTLSFIALAQSVQPGVWHTESTFKLNGVPLPTSQKKECLDKEAAKDLKSNLTEELKKNGCEPTKWVTKATQIEIDLKCAKSGLNAQGSLSGTLTDKSYNLSGDAEGNYQGFPSKANMALKGQWLEACNK